MRFAHITNPAKHHEPNATESFIHVQTNYYIYRIWNTRLRIYQIPIFYMHIRLNRLSLDVPCKNIVRMVVPLVFFAKQDFGGN